MIRRADSSCCLLRLRNAVPVGGIPKDHQQLAGRRKRFLPTPAHHLWRTTGSADTLPTVRPQRDYHTAGVVHDDIVARFFSISPIAPGSTSA